MDIGKEKEKITVEPLEDPVPKRDSPPDPQRPVPGREPTKPVRVPANP